MATLNPQASEFTPETNLFIPYPTLPSFTWYPSPLPPYAYYPNFTFLQYPTYHSSFNYNYNSSNFFYFAPPWLNLPLPLPPPRLPPPSPPPPPQKKAKKVCKGKVAADRLEYIRVGDSRTTVMIRNIPNRYTEKLMKELDEHCKQENEKHSTTATNNLTEEDEDAKDVFSSAYDFLYLPIDFRHNLNVGYAFVNFTNPNAAWKISLSWQCKKWNLFKSNKICEIVYADVQGKDKLVNQFEGSRFACDNEDFLPVTFNLPRDGSGKEVQQCSVGKCTGRATTT